MQANRRSFPSAFTSRSSIPTARGTGAVSISGEAEGGAPRPLGRGECMWRPCRTEARSFAMVCRWLLTADANLRVAPMDDAHRQGLRPLSPGCWRRTPDGQVRRPSGWHRRRSLAEASVPSRPTFGGRSAEALFLEAGAVHRSRLLAQALCSFRALPSGAVALRSLSLVHSRTASPRPLPSRRFGCRATRTACCRQPAPLMSRHPASPGPCSMSESVAVPPLARWGSPMLPWAFCSSRHSGTWSRGTLRRCWRAFSTSKSPPVWFGRSCRRFHPGAALGICMARANFAIP